MFGSARDRLLVVTGRVLRAVPISLVTILIVAGCHRETKRSSSISIEQEILPQPARIGQETINLKLADPNGSSISGATIRIEGDMVHPGMAPTFADATEVEAGRYQAHLQLTMGGDWVILLHIKLKDGQSLERQIDLRGVQSN